MTHVRAARPEDYDDFVRLYREISLGEPAAEQRSWDGLHCRQARMAVEGDRVVGYLRYELFDDFAYVHHLSVAPEARRRGVGLKLMRHAAGEIRAHGIRRWMLHVLADNAAAQALYALLGLERAGRSTTLSVSFDALERASGDVSATLRLAASSMRAETRVCRSAISFCIASRSCRPPASWASS